MTVMFFVIIAIIFILLYQIFYRISAAMLVFLSLLLALASGLWLLIIVNFKLSVAVMVGFIALTDVAAEFGIIMLIYLD